MKFCEICQSVLTPLITPTGILKLQCDSCRAQYDSKPEDTLRKEHTLEASKTEEKFGDFIKNAAHDTVGNKVAHPCKKCNMPYQTLIYVGESRSAIYTCVCGNKTTVESWQSKNESVK